MKEKKKKNKLVLTRLFLCQLAPKVGRGRFRRDF